MSELTGEEYFPHDTYHTQWFLFWAIAVVSGVLLWLHFFKPTPITAPPKNAISAGYDWFLMLHMPEAPKDPAKAAALQEKFGGWLGALSKEGYHPMLLSDVQKRVAQGVGLPDRAVVLVFDPAYYHTYQTLAPVLVQYQFPAFWVSDRTAVLRGDRHFIHRHQATWMIHSGYWDLGYTGDGFWRQVSDSNQITINESGSASWVANKGRTALNWISTLPHLNRLDVNPKWTPDELITRLQMEIPLTGTVRLGLKRIENRWWGVVLPYSKKDGRFSQQTLLTETSSNLYWLGTRGVPDVQADVDIPSFFGEVSLWLRSDYKKGKGVGVGFTRRELYIDQQVNGSRKRLALVPWTPPSGALKGRITLQGSALEVAMEGLDPFTVALLEDTPSSDGFIRLQVHDHVRGAARADFVSLTVTSLSKPPPH